MSENNNTTENKVDINELAAKLAKGTLTLAKPIKARGKEINELPFDFQQLTGIEYVNAMSVESSKNIFELTQKQALNLFAAAAAKQSADADAKDIYEQIGIEDTIKAVQAATLFFNTSVRADSAHITRD